MSEPATPAHRFRVRVFLEGIRGSLSADSAKVDKLGHVVARKKFKLGQEDEALAWPTHAISVLCPDGDAHGTREFRDPKGYRVVEVKVRPEDAVLV